ncbi:hypothetical protein OF83DRAFT_780527 [Amylostereum chailletii]|nr:hypothetical protein OF83DRAFT_780527 [Amylostereum chailletii]
MAETTFVRELFWLLLGVRHMEFDARIRSSTSHEEYERICNALTLVGTGHTFSGPDVLLLTLRGFDAILYEPSGRLRESGGAISQSKLDELCESIELNIQRQQATTSPPAPPGPHEQARVPAGRGGKRTHSVMVAETQDLNTINQSNATPERSTRGKAKGNAKNNTSLSEHHHEKAPEPMHHASADVRLPALERWVSEKPGHLHEYISVFKLNSPTSNSWSPNYPSTSRPLSSNLSHCYTQPASARNAFPQNASLVYSHHTHLTTRSTRGQS